MARLLSLLLETPMLPSTRLSSLLPFIALRPNLTTTSSSSSHRLNTHCFLGYLHFSTATNETKSPSPHFMADYLANSIGLSKERAIRASSKYLAHLTTHDNPDSVLRFLKRSFSLDDARIRTLVSWCPTLLLYDVEKTLKPRLSALQEAGFSEPVLVELLRSNPTFLLRRNVLPRLTFWRDFVGGDETKMINLLKRNRNLLCYDIDSKIIPNIAFLRSLDLSGRDILLILTKMNSFVLRSPSSMKSLIDRTEELGFQRGSGMFIHGLSVVVRLTPAALERKLELFRSIGWSETKLWSAIRRYPTMLLLSEKNVHAKMSFLVKEAGCEPLEVVFRPILLAFSLEKRLIPRYHVVKILKDLGIKDYQFTKLMHLSDKKFAEKCILPHKEEVPNLHEAFVADCAGRILI